jgi:hypothetical protein
MQIYKQEEMAHNEYKTLFIMSNSENGESELCLIKDAKGNGKHKF